MVTLDEVAAAAIALPEVTEELRYGHRSWAVHGKVFAWDRHFSKADIRRFGSEPVPEGPILGLSVADLSDKEAVLEAHEAVFTIPHFDGYPAVLVRLTHCSPQVLAELLEDAWLCAAPPALARELLGRALIAMATFRWILHLDLDQFIAAVEVRRRPELVGLPVVVGGDGDPKRMRQVVATASYEARRFGVRSGMPMSTAARRCPDAVFLPMDQEAYDEASAQVWAVVRELPVVVEVWGWDEGFLGSNDDDPVALAHHARAVVASRTGLTCCVGVGDDKPAARLATGFAKAPAGSAPSDAPGVVSLTRADWMQVMGDRPVDALWGVGSRTSAKLGELGIRTVADLGAAEDSALASRFGPRIGPWLRTLGLGLGSREVSDVPWVPRGRSREETYTTDVTEREHVEAHLRKLARAVTQEVVGDGRTVTHVAIKVRFVPFWTATRVTRLKQATTDPDLVADTAVALLDRFDVLRPIRLLGVRVDLAPPPQP